MPSLIDGDLLTKESEEYRGMPSKFIVTVICTVAPDAKPVQKIIAPP
jgi:hypothetical protein